MDRGEGPRADPAATRAWVERSRRKAVERARSKPRKPLGRSSAAETGSKTRSGSSGREKPKKALRAGGRARRRLRNPRLWYGDGGPSGHLAHHVVYEQHVRAAKGDDSDPRNRYWIRKKAHDAHHGGSERISLAALSDENFEFALELLGEGAYYYLRRRYSGEDVRLDALYEMTGPPGRAGATDEGEDG